jgi:hypothetical protein
MSTYTTQQRFIEHALSAHSRSFAQLELQMDAFEPLPLESFQNNWQQMWDQMRPINDGTSDEQLTGFIDSQIAIRSSEKMQYIDKFLEPFAAEAVAITILSHALAEATINAALALGLAHVGKASLFLLLERANIKHKWTVGPQSFLSTYTLPRSEAIYACLTTLCRRRNSYVHSKITLRDEVNHVLVAGSADTGISIGHETRTMLHRFLSIPYDLHLHLMRQIEDRSLRFILEDLLNRS